MQNGRPKKKKDTVKSRIIRIRVSPIEFADLTEKSRAANLTVSQLIRRSLASAVIVPLDPDKIKVIRDAQTELVRIGQNINQLARTRYPHPEEVEFWLREAKDELKKFKNKML